MPELSRFYGIVIRMYFDDHPPPHFHAEYGGSKVVIDIDTLAVVHGKIAPRALGLVMEWASAHQDELKAAWQKAVHMESPSKIEPLK